MKFNTRSSAYYICLITVASLILCLIYGIRNIDLFGPLNDSADSFTSYTFAKGIIENGWYLSNPMLGAPDGMQVHDFPLFDNLQFFIIKIMGYILISPILTINLYYFLTFILTAISASIVLKHFKISSSVSFVFSLLYAFQSYHHLRGIGHLFLSGYFMLPLAIMVILWIYDGKILFKKTAPQNNYLYFAILILCLLSLTGIYYSFFSCLFIAVAGIAKAIKDRKWNSILISLSMISVVFLGLLIQVAPTLYYKVVNGANPQVAQRYMVESELYALKPIQLLLPIQGHQWSAFATKTLRYNTEAPLVNENAMSSIGFFGSCGLILLLCLLLFPDIYKTNKTLSQLKDRLSQLSKLSIFAILYSTVGGISMIVAVCGFTNIRAANRMSIIISFFALFAVALILDAYLKSKNKILSFVVLLAILSLGITDQTPVNLSGMQSFSQKYKEEEAFFSEVENKYKEGMFFQLPYLAFPESPVKLGWTDYSHFKAYLHTKTIKWSYGTIKGRPADLWQKNTAGMEVPKMIATLKQAKFDGIYVDKIGVEDSTLIPSLEKALGSPDLVSKNGELIIYKFK